MVHRRRRRRRHAAHGARQCRAAAGIRAPQRRSVAADGRRDADAGRPCGYARWPAPPCTSSTQSAGRTDADDDGRGVRRRVASAFHDVARRCLCLAGARVVARRLVRGRVVFGRRTNARARLPLSPSARRRQTCSRWCLSDGLKLVGIGVVLGLAGAFVLARFLETQLFGVTAHDPVTFIAVPVLLMAPPSPAASSPPAARPASTR